MCYVSLWCVGRRPGFSKCIYITVSHWQFSSHSRMCRSSKKEVVVAVIAVLVVVVVEAVLVVVVVVSS